MHITLPTQSCSHTHICKHPICVYPSWSFFFFKNSFIYLAALGLSCGMRESSLQCMDSPVVGPNCSTVRDILVPMKVAQSCLTLCDPMDYTAHGILQARILEWVAFPFSPTQGSNPGLLHCRQVLFQLSHKRSPIIFILIIWLFIFGGSESSLLRGLFSSCMKWGCSSLPGVDFLLQWFLWLQSSGSRAWAQ